MHCGPGLMSCCAFASSRLRREELSDVFGLCACAYVCACVGCASCVRLCRICCVTYRYIYQVRVGLLLLVGRGDLETKTKRNEALACVRESACDDNSCRMTSVLLRQTNLAIESFIMCAAEHLGQALPAG